MNIKRAAALLLCALVMLAVCALAESDEERYTQAMALYEAGDYEGAYEAFSGLDAYADSKKLASDCLRKLKKAKYEKATALYEAGDYDTAKALFEELDDYNQSRSFLKNCNYRITVAEYSRAREAYDAGNYEEALVLFEKLGKYRDCRERVAETKERLAEKQMDAEEAECYEKAVALRDAGDLEAARDLFIQAGNCKDATAQVYAIYETLNLRACYQKALKLMESGDFLAAADWFELMGNYEDCPAQAEKAKEAYLNAVRAEAEACGDANVAYMLLTAIGDGAEKPEDGKALYKAAQEMQEQGRYAEAAAGYAAASYKDSAELADEMSVNAENQRQFDRAFIVRALGHQEEANAMLKALGGWKHADRFVTPIIIPQFGARRLRDDKTTEKSDVFVAPDGSRHCYQMFKGVRTWIEAKSFCEVLGGHLATLTTPEENDFVYGFMRENGFLTAYFGLSDEARVGDWVWVTDEPFEYTNWHRNEPSHSGRERYGMYFYKHLDGTWNDAHFYENAKVDPGCSYICEWDE